MSPEHYGKEVFLKKLTSLIEANLENEGFGVSELARETGMSRSNLHRKVKSITGKSVSQLIREIRLEKARELLNKGEYNVSEIAYRVGFGSVTYFSKCFHDLYGYPPGEAAEHEPGESSPVKSAAGHQIQASSRRRYLLPWVITILVAIVAVVLLVINLIPSSSRDSDSNPVIAVLPFHNDSPEQQNAYMVNGLMEEILNKLSLVEDLNVISRTSSEAYRDSDKSLRDIGKELQASHILEGSATILNKRTRIRLQLIETETDKHLWSKPYEQEISLENLFEVQQEVALAVTSELRLVLNRQEKEQIFAKPSENLDAYEAFLQARECINLLGQHVRFPDKRALQQRAKQLLDKAMELDPDFPGTYILLGHMYINQFYYNEEWQDLSRAYSYLDLGRFMVEKALTLYDGESGSGHPKDGAYNWANGLMAEYYQRKGNYEIAEKYREESFKGYWIPYLRYRSEVGWYSEINQYSQAIDNYLSFLKSKPEYVSVPAYIYDRMYKTYCGAGFPEQAKKHSEQILETDGDSVAHYQRMRDMHRWQGNYTEALRLTALLSEMDPDWPWYFTGPIWYKSCMGKFEETIPITQKGVERLMQKGNEIGPSCTIGYVYMQSGKREEAKPMLEADRDRLSGDLEYPTRDTRMGYNHLHLARIYSILGDKENTLANLAPLRNLPGVHIRLITELRDWPSYDLVRDTREFKEIYSLLEKRYQKEYERIARLLEKDNSLN